ncbi:DUF6185 family protein [Streptomyces sp. NPDC013455]|uniref:DUF6185 family protein n=1 Tax=Streptomyces sp. NPDC013455 TaxID=3155605 RepID=UPI0034113B93
MIRRPPSPPGLLLSVVLLAVLSVWASAGTSSGAADGADTCGMEGMRGLKVTASADFEHRGLDYSKVESVLDIEIPASWKHAPDLLLDTHAPEYRQALRCLLGTVWEENPLTFDEQRPKPLTVDFDGKTVVVHYEAVVWVQWLGTHQIGPWQLEAGRDVWTIQFAPPLSLWNAAWEKVEVRTGGPRALSVSPESATGEDGTVLKWENEEPTNFTVSFRPPAAQRWGATTLSPEQAWEALGMFSGSSAMVDVTNGALLLLAGRRLRQGIARPLADDEQKALGALRSWALLSAGIGMLVYMGDNVHDFLGRAFSWSGDYTTTLSLLLLVLLGIALCLFGRCRKFLLVAACAVGVTVAGMSVGCEVAECALLPESESHKHLFIYPAGSWVTLLVYTAAVSVFFMGAISSVRRAVRMDGGALPSWQVVSLSVGLSAVTVLWALLAFWRYWDRISWLADTGWPTYTAHLQQQFTLWWWDFPDFVLSDLWDAASFALLALVPMGALYVCRAERQDDSSFTPTGSERFLLVVVFTLVVLPGGEYHFGVTGYFITVALGLLLTWALLSWTGRKAVLMQPSVGNRPLGQVMSMTDRSGLLRMVRRYRDLQECLHHPGAKHGDSTADREAIEREIDQMDQYLPEGVRLVDVAFACGPMTTWWANARRCAVIGCLVGLPGTGLMYWYGMVSGGVWTTTVENRSGVPSIVLNVLAWHVTWVAAAFFMGALWRSLPGRHGPTKAFYIATVFAVPVCVHWMLGELSGQDVRGSIATIATFTSVMTFTGLVMDVQTFMSERRYWPSSASLVMYIYQMRLASVAFLLAQLVALATIWQAFRNGGPSGRPPSP